MSGRLTMQEIFQPTSNIFISLQNESSSAEILTFRTFSRIFNEKYPTTEVRETLEPVRTRTEPILTKWLINQNQECPV